MEKIIIESFEAWSKIQELENNSDLFYRVTITGNGVDDKDAKEWFDSYGEDDYDDNKAQALVPPNLIIEYDSTAGYTLEELESKGLTEDGEIVPADDEDAIYNAFGELGNTELSDFLAGSNGFDEEVFWTNIPHSEFLKTFEDVWFVDREIEYIVNQ